MSNLLTALKPFIGAFRNVSSFIENEANIYGIQPWRLCRFQIWQPLLLRSYDISSIKAGLIDI
jgi:hypothetical protein